MAKEIPAELKDFKNALEGKTGSMSSKASEIVSSMTKVADASTSAKGEIDVAYKPADGNNQASAKLDSLSTLITAIGSDVTSTISSACSQADSIIGKVSEMETLITNIEAQEARKRTAQAKKPDPDTATISDADAKIKEYETQFDEKEAAATSELAALRGMDKSVDSSSASTGAPDTAATETKLAEYTKYLSQLKYGTFTELSFTASNGISINYFLYKPDYGTEVEGLPVFMYMHGIGFNDTGTQIVTYGGLGEAIKNKTVTPSGIVVMPHVKNGRLYENENYRDALAELAVQVCKDNNGDTNRISVGGCSYGAVTAFRLVTEHPGTFSAVVNAAGAADVTDAFKDVKVWNFNGRRDDPNHTGKSYVAKANKAVESVGGSAMYTLFDDVWGHTNVATKAFQNKYQDENGEYIYPFEWAFKQTKEEPVKTVSA